MSKRTLIRCKNKNCNGRPLADIREDKIRVMQFYDYKPGYTEIKTTHNAGGKSELICSKCGTKAFIRGEVALGLEYQIAKK